jgi:uncharacterized protein YjbI with pentapeptide repeats
MKREMDMEVLTRLIQGKSFDGLEIGLKNDRLDLRGLTIPEPAIGKTLRTTIADVSEMEGLVVRGATWKHLDFSGSHLNGLRFFDCVINNCVFDNCSCRDWRLWATTISETSLHSTNLRKSVLGGVLENKRNTFRNVDFTAADLRQTSYVAAEFVGSTFKNTRLDKVDFQTSTFAKCKFEGELRESSFI